MWRSASFSVATQSVASIGNLACNLLLLRLLSLEQFGTYVYLLIFALFAANFSARVAGQVYHYCRPERALLARGYARAYDGFSLIVILGTAAIVSAVFVAMPAIEPPVSAAAVCVLVLGATAVENLKLEATANGLYRTVLAVELARLALIVAALPLLAWQGWLSIDTAVATLGIIALVAAGLLMKAVAWRPSFRRLAWTARLHWRYARHLVPAQLVGAVHFSGLQFVALAQFGAGGLGVLRLAEMPFSALHPFKQSLVHFLPREVHAFERTTAGGRQLAAVAALALAATTLAAGAALVGGMVLTEPLTTKSYPVELGLVFAACYVAMVLVEAVSQYLGAIGLPGKVLVQHALGAVVAFALYFATQGWLGLLAYPVAMLASFVAIAGYGAVHVALHVLRRSAAARGARPRHAD